MTEITTIDSLPVASLPQRYGISRSVLYERFADLSIETEKRGNKAFVNADQIQLLDALNAHLKEGGSTADFLEIAGLSAKQTAGQLTRQSDRHSEATQENALAALLGAMVHLSPTPDPLANLDALEKACTNGWHLSTSQLAPLLGLKTLRGSPFQRYGFTFTKVGKNGAESAWSVTKASEAAQSS